MATFDIETTEGVSDKFEMLGFYDGIEGIIFDSVRAFLDAVLVKRYRSFAFYAHNAERFDFKFLIGEFLKMEIGENQIRAANGKILFIKFFQAGERIREIYLCDANRNTWRFVDSFWLMPTSLKKITTSFKVASPKGEIDYAQISIKDPVSRAYCLNDCKGLYESLFAYFNQKIFNGLKPKGTIASNAMQIYRAGMKQPLKGINHEQEQFIRHAYFGGRVEIFRTHGRALNCYDFNSLYPSVMVDSEYPTGLPAWVDRYEQGAMGFYWASINMPDDIGIPPLPVVRNGKLVFPVGQFSGHFSSCELDCALRLGATVKVKRGLVFLHTEKIFTKYVKELYALKAKADKESADYMIAKLYLNGLYGKFGQRREQCSIIRCDSDYAAEKGLTPYLPDFGLYLQKQQSRGAYIMPNIAAWVTAQARLKLYSVLDNNSYYCDTDSIFTPNQLPCSDIDLGALKFEKRIEQAYFLLPKVYYLKLERGLEQVKAKGFGKDFLKSVGEQEFKRALKGDLSGFKTSRYQLLGTKDSIRRFGKVPVMADVKKSLHHTYAKRIVLSDGRTKPLVLCEPVI